MYIVTQKHVSAKEHKCDIQVHSKSISLKAIFTFKFYEKAYHFQQYFSKEIKIRLLLMPFWFGSFNCQPPSKKKQQPCPFHELARYNTMVLYCQNSSENSTEVQNSALWMFLWSPAHVCDFYRSPAIGSNQQSCLLNRQASRKILGARLKTHL